MSFFSSIGKVFAKAEAFQAGGWLSLTKKGKKLTKKATPVLHYKIGGPTFTASTKAGRKLLRTSAPYAAAAAVTVASGNPGFGATTYQVTSNVAQGGSLKGKDLFNLFGSQAIGAINGTDFGRGLADSGFNLGDLAGSLFGAGGSGGPPPVTNQPGTSVGALQQGIPTGYVLIGLGVLGLVGVIYAVRK